MVHLNKIQQSLTNIKSTNIKIKLGIPELPTESVTVSKAPGPEVLGNTSESGVIELPTCKHKWTQEENRMLWKHYFESHKNVTGYMERMHWLWIERGGGEMTKQILRTQVRNIEKKNLLSDVEIGEIVGAGR